MRWLLIVVFPLTPQWGGDMEVRIDDGKRSVLPEVAIGPDVAKNSEKRAPMAMRASLFDFQLKEQKGAARKFWNKLVIDRPVVASYASPPAAHGVIVPQLAKFDVTNADKNTGTKLVETLRTMDWPASGRLGYGWSSAEIPMYVATKAEYWGAVAFLSTRLLRTFLKECPRWTYSYFSAARWRGLRNLPIQGGVRASVIWAWSTSGGVAAKRGFSKKYNAHEKLTGSTTERRRTCSLGATTPSPCSFTISATSRTTRRKQGLVHAGSAWAPTLAAVAMKQMKKTGTTKMARTIARFPEGSIHNKSLLLHNDVETSYYTGQHTSWPRHSAELLKQSKYTHHNSHRRSRRAIQI